MKRYITECIKFWMRNDISFSKSKLKYIMNDNYAIVRIESRNDKYFNFLFVLLLEGLIDQNVG